MFFIVILCSFKVNCHLKAVGFHNNEKGWGDWSNGSNRANGTNETNGAYETYATHEAYMPY